MRTRAKGTSRAAVLAVGFVALGVAAIPSHALADVTNGGGFLSGDQVNAPISAPGEICSSAAGLASTQCHLGHGASYRTTLHPRTLGQQTSALPNLGGVHSTSTLRQVMPSSSAVEMGSAGGSLSVRAAAGEGRVVAAQRNEPGVTWTFGAAAVLAGLAGVLRLARRVGRR